MPWLLFGIGFFAYLLSVGIAIAEIGDVFVTQNDRSQRFALIACPVLFNVAVVWAAFVWRAIAAGLFAMFSGGLCLLAWRLLGDEFQRPFQ
jgi:hypothetical protein